MSSEALLPCPFCGNNDIHMSDLNDEDDRRMWVREIECDICQLKMRDWTGWPGKGEPFDRQKMSDAVGAALAKQWNRRATPSPASGELASLVERLAARTLPGKWADVLVPDPDCVLAASQLAAVAAERDALVKDNDRLRVVVSQSADATGAFISPKASIDFMEKLPGEIRLNRSGAERLLAEGRTTIDLIREEAAKPNSPLGRSDSLALNRIRTALSIGGENG